MCCVALLASLDPTGQVKCVSAATSLLPSLLEEDDEALATALCHVAAEEEPKCVSAATSLLASLLEEDDEALATTLCHVAAEEAPKTSTAPISAKLRS